jgi:hypothetical protein
MTLSATGVLLDAIEKTTAQITDARLDVISHAREVLERARSEHGAWRGGSLLPVTAAMAALEGALREVDEAGSYGDVDEAVRFTSWWDSRVVAVIEDVMGPEAAAYVNGTEGES